jgi:hypothetical protein
MSLWKTSNDGTGIARMELRETGSANRRRSIPDCATLIRATGWPGNQPRKAPPSGGAFQERPILLAGLLLALPILILLLVRPLTATLLLLARLLATTLLLPGLLIRILALLTGLVLVRHARSPFLAGYEGQRRTADVVSRATPVST